MKHAQASDSLRLAELVAALSLGIDLGFGQPMEHVLRQCLIALEFVLGGHRDVDNMIASHAALAQDLAKRLGLQENTVRAVGAAYEHWDGTGWPGKLAGAAIPLASRIATLAEFVEVAHRSR